jgi:hypothetical protein
MSASPVNARAAHGAAAGLCATALTPESMVYMEALTDNAAECIIILAELAGGVSPPYVEDVERMAAAVAVVAMCKLANATGADAQELSRWLTGMMPSE